MHLTEISVRALKGSEKYLTHYDDSTPGFGVRCGLKSKTYIVVRGRSRERISLGKVGDISLADARKEAKRLLTEMGAEPKLPAKTLAQAREEFLTEHYQGNTSRWPHLVRLQLEGRFKKIEHRSLADITDADIRRVLDALKGTPSAQLHLYRAARTFFTWCTRPPRRYLRQSPMDGYAPPGADKKGTRTLSDPELAAVWAAADAGARLILRLMILWGTRNEETCVLKRAWRADDVLTIPGESTKNGRDHGVPVLPLASAILDDRPRTSDYYFPGRHSDAKPINPSSLNRLLREIQQETGTSGWTLRDIRRTFRSNMARLKVPREVCEVLINHAPPVLDEIYDRYDRLDEKREALAKYEAFLVQLLTSGESA